MTSLFVSRSSEPSKSTISFFDGAVLEMLAVAIGWPDTFAILDVFLADTPPRLAKLRQDTKAGDAAAVERHLHALKSAAGSLGFTQLAQLSRDLQAPGAMSGPASLFQVSARVDAAFAQGVAEAAEWRVQHEAGHARG